MADLSNMLLSSLSNEAISSDRLRKSYNLHSSYQENCQRFMNAISIGSYIPPHRHLVDPKQELLVAVTGKFALIEFTDNGNFKRFIEFSTEKYFNSDSSRFGVEVSPERWHTVIALEQHSVLLEVKEGPFFPDKAKELAKWAPTDKCGSKRKYVNSLYEFCGASSLLEDLNQ